MEREVDYDPRAIIPFVPEKTLDITKLKDYGPSIYGPSCLVTIVKSDETVKFPLLFLLRDYKVQTRTLKKIYLCEYAKHCFYSLEVKGCDEFVITNYYGEFMLHFKTHKYYFNKGKDVDMTSEYKAGAVKVDINRYTCCSGLPSYYSTNYVHLFPENFSVSYDQLCIYSKSSDIVFKGATTTKEPQLKMPPLTSGEPDSKMPPLTSGESDTVRFYTLGPSFLIFDAHDISYGIPIETSTSCTYYKKTSTLECSNSSRGTFYYNLKKCTLGIDQMEILTVNIFGRRVIHSDTVDHVLEMAHEKLNEISHNKPTTELTGSSGTNPELQSSPVIGG